jgi:hypothetical protein
MQEAQAGDAIKPFHHLWMERVVKIEQNGAIARESIREQHLARAEFVLSVVRPETVLADRRRGDNGSVSVAIPREIDPPPCSTPKS